MPVNTALLSFYSGYPIDKIITQGIQSYTLASGTPVSFPPYVNSLKTIPNTYGQKVLINASWSVDGTNYISTQAQLNWTLNGQPTIKAQVNVGADVNNLYFYLINNFNQTLTYTINYAVYSIT